MSNVRSRKAASSILYKLLESFGTQGISFVVSLLLARILDLADYGVLSLLTAFITIAQVFVTNGMNMSLIQKKEVDETDYSSAFWFSLSVATALYAVLFFCAPAISAYYDSPLICDTLRVLALILFPGAFLCVQNAIVARNMTFQHLMISSIVSTVISGTIGIVSALNGGGCWALVWQQLTNQFIQAVILTFLTRWHPVFRFSWQRIHELFGFGWKLLVSSLLDTAYSKLRTAIIGKRYDTETLGSYSRGQQFPEMIMNAVNGSIQSVLFPVLSESQDEPQKVKDMMRRGVTLSSLLVVPVMAGMAAVATPMVSLLLTDKWLVCVPFLQIACLDFSFYPIHTANLQAISAMGRSDVFLKLEIVKKISGITILILSVFLFDSVYAIAWGAALNGLICTFINAWPNRKLLDYSYMEQVRDIFPAYLMSGIMFLAVSALGLLPLSPILLLPLQIVSGIGIYALLILCSNQKKKIALAVELFKNRKASGR